MSTGCGGGGDGDSDGDGGAGDDGSSDSSGDGSIDGSIDFYMSSKILQLWDCLYPQRTAYITIHAPPTVPSIYHSSPNKQFISI